MTIYLDSSRREKLPGGCCEYPLSCMHVDFKKVQELKDDCFVKMKVKRGMGTMRKVINAQHLIQCLKEHCKFCKIHIKLDISSFRPLSFEMKIKVKELHQPRELYSAER
ncbi:hypothetical protein E2C01_100201 [Portunus trituberculatus]|uniref:Uncharacterized protein n=1 Tax=Portunus trituberculatus TaxID=210409 RepID=A0A5B7KGS8_PORTR|nr:hypothetical protein [Portunus trituberculatus]